MTNPDAVRYETELLTCERVEWYWPLIKKSLSQVPHIWEPWWALEDLLSGAMQQRFQVWAVGPINEVHLIVFTCIECFPTSRTLQAFLAFGNHVEECLPSLAASLEKFAINTKCDRFELRGRDGWGPKLAPYGLQSIGRLYARPVYPQGVH